MIKNTSVRDILPFFADALSAESNAIAAQRGMNVRGVWWALLAAGAAAALPKERKSNLMKLPSFRGVAEVRSSLPGRMRLYMPAVSEAREQAEQMKTQLEGTGVIRREGARSTAYVAGCREYGSFGRDGGPAGRENAGRRRADRGGDSQQGAERLGLAWRGDAAVVGGPAVWDAGR